jgi:uncharacterized protein (TIGR03066 family)
MRLILMVASAMFGLDAMAAPVPKAVKAKTVEDRLIGKWKMISSDNGSSTNFHVIYSKNGVMEFRYEDANGRISTSYPGKFKASEPDSENKIGTIDWTVKQGNSERGEKSRILELTDDVLEFVDPEGVKERFQRVKDDK